MVVGSIIGGVFNNKAAKEQAQSFDNAAAVQRQNFEDSIDLIQPQIDSGNRFREALEFELLGGDRPTLTLEPEEAAPAVNPFSITPIAGGPIYEQRNERDETVNVLTGFDVDRYDVNGELYTTRAAADNRLAELTRQWEAEQPGAQPQNVFEYQGFQATPGYQFRLDEGQKALERSAAARGMLNSGATGKALLRYGQDYASNEYNTFLNRLSTAAGAGQVASQNAAGLYQSQGNALAGLAVDRGNALASGQRAIGQSAQSGFNNLVGAGSFLYGTGAFG